jgi:tetratricopeptide (TPR) repeat protein
MHRLAAEAVATRARLESKLARMRASGSETSIWSNSSRSAVGPQLLAQSSNRPENHLSKSFALSSPACTQTSSSPPGEPEMAAPPTTSYLNPKAASECNHSRQRDLLAHDRIAVIEAFRVDGRVGAERVRDLGLARAVLHRVRARAVAAQLYDRHAVLIDDRCRTSAMALAMTGVVECGTGNTAKAFELIERARRLSPRDPRDWFMSAALATVCTFEGRYAEAVVWSEKALIQKRFAPGLRQLAFALVMTGQKERAHEVVQEVLKIEPGLSISRLRLRVPFGRDPTNPYWQKFSEALRSAGLPEVSIHRH